MTTIDIDSMSNAADLGLRALADLSDAAAGHEYRVIGGHMVHILCHVYPTEEATKRATADADAGVTPEVAAGLGIHRGLVERGYHRVGGNRWEAPTGESDAPLAVDLLVPSTSDTKIETKILGEDHHGFDAIPGLSLALNSPPLEVTVRTRFYTGDVRTFDVCVPGVEAAVVLKALAWNSRFTPKDIEDLGSLLAIVHHHFERISWRLDQPCKGARGDAARVLRDLHRKVDKGHRIEGLAVPRARFGAFIQRYVHM